MRIGVRGASRNESSLQLTVVVGKPFMEMNPCNLVEKDRDEHEFIMTPRFLCRFKAKAAKDIILEEQTADSFQHQ